MKASKTFFNFFRRKGGDEVTAKKGGLLKKSTMGLAALFLIRKVKFLDVSTIMRIVLSRVSICTSIIHNLIGSKRLI